MLPGVAKIYFSFLEFKLTIECNEKAIKFETMKKEKEDKKRLKNI